MGFRGSEVQILSSRPSLINKAAYLKNKRLFSLPNTKAALFDLKNANIEADLTTLLMSLPRKSIV